MKVTVFGAGYVGLVTAACFAEVGNHVMCVDVDEKRIARLREGVIPIYEPGLEEIVKGAVSSGRMSFTTNAAEGVAHAEIQFIAVGTPPDEDGSADLKYVLAVAETIAAHMAAPKIVVDKSTVPVGTADKVKARIAQTLANRRSNLPFHVVSNPEFLKEGAAVVDFMRPDRIVIGSDSEYAFRRMSELYAPFNRNHQKIISMDLRSAEFTKYVANAMLATKISFMNEMAVLAESLNADIEQVRIGIGADPRIGYHFIYPGCGYGGSCFPKDVKALIHSANQVGFQAQVLQSVESRNDQQKNLLFSKIAAYFGSDLTGKTIALWGLSFKPKTDDMREAPSRNLIEALWAAGANVRAYDPEAMDECRRIYGSRAQLVLCDCAEDAVLNADALAVVTEWQLFKSPDFDFLKANLRHGAIFDGRNLYEPEQVASAGLAYIGIGRPMFTSQQ